MQPAIRIRTDWVALFAGLAIAAALVATWRVDNGEAAPPARVEIMTSPSSRSRSARTASRPAARSSFPPFRRTASGGRSSFATPRPSRTKSAEGRRQPGRSRPGRGVGRPRRRASATAAARRARVGLGAVLARARAVLPLTVAAWIPEGASAPEWAGRTSPCRSSSRLAEARERRPDEPDRGRLRARLRGSRLARQSGHPDASSCGSPARLPSAWQSGSQRSSR